MAYRFADFELDEDRRELRLEGREIALQPRVFDLLAYLIHHRERVVAKDELLDALWPGTVVVDGALQRVVSLARSALQQGGARDAIRTYPRRGYRFSAEVATDAGSVTDMAVSSTLGRARRAFERNDWAEAVHGFHQADAESALMAADLERWAEAAHWNGTADAALASLERAVAVHSTQRDRQGAARAALLLAEIQFERLEISVARGWLRRAESFLDKAVPSRELGLLHYLSARIELLEGLLEDALENAKRAHALGRELDDPDLEGLGLLYWGHALLALGEIDRGVEHHDEAAAVALAGEVSAWVGGLLYCGVIWACRNRGDWSRAAQWTEQFTRWCERSGLEAFPGTCRLHRAEVLSIQGELAEAEKEISKSTEQLSSWAPWAEGDAYRVLGDLRLARGDLDEAETAYRRAHELGWDPQPGHALLQMARGEAAAAVRALQRSLDDRSWANRERRGLLLAHLVVASVAADQMETARDTLAELEDHPELWRTQANEAMVARARSEWTFSEGHTEDAIHSLRRAIAIWQQVASPLHVAGLQLRLGEMLLADNDPQGAELELSAAESAFRKLDAPALAERCVSLRESL